MESAWFGSSLSRTQFAKLMAAASLQYLPEGAELTQGDVDSDSLLMVEEGLVELIGDSGKVGVAGPQQSCFEEAMLGLPVHYYLRALQETRLVVIPGTAVRRTLQHEAFQTQLWRRTALHLLPGREHEAAATSMGATVQPGARELAPTLVESEWNLPAALMVTGGAAALFGLLWALGLDARLAASGVVLGWALCCWCVNLLPDYVVALAGLGTMLGFGLTSPAVGLSGFASTTWIMTLGVLGTAVVITRSGLFYRVALHALRLLPPTVWGQSIALTIAGVLMTPVLPSPSGRVALAAPLVLELTEEMGLPWRSKGSAGMASAVLVGFGQMYFLFLNGTGTCLLLWSLLPAAARSQITWGAWFWYALPLAVVVLAVSLAGILWWYRGETTTLVRSETVAHRLRALGPTTGPERRMLWISGGMLLAYMTQGWHKVDPAWISLAGFLLLASVSQVQRDQLRRTIDWPFLLLYGAVVGFAAALQESGLVTLWSGWLAEGFRSLERHPDLFLLAAAGLTFLVRLAVPMIPAVLLMAVTLYPLATKAGIHPFLITLVVQVAANPFLFPHQNTTYQALSAATEGKAFTHRQMIPFAVLFALASVLAVGVAAPFWRWMGLMP